MKNIRTRNFLKVQEIHAGLGSWENPIHSESKPDTHFLWMRKDMAAAQPQKGFNSSEDRGRGVQFMRVW